MNESIEMQSFKRFKEIFPDSAISVDQWKSEEKTIKITPQIAQFLLDILFEASVGANKYQEYAEKMKAILDWTVNQGLQTEQDKEACLIEFDAVEDE